MLPQEFIGREQRRYLGLMNAQNAWPRFPEPKPPFRNRWERHPVWCRAVLWDCFLAAPFFKKLRAIRAYFVR